MWAQFIHTLNIVPFGLWLTVGTAFLGWFAWIIWIHYVQQDFIAGIDFLLIEIVPPREVLRSPRAMELFFTNALYQLSNKGPREAYWRGEVQFWFSLEIVSIEGQVHFYIRTPSRLKELIETQMYAQYPQAQVKVVEDYTLAVDKISEQSEWNLWGCEYKLTKPDVFPLKTYIDFGLDKDPKEEYKIDPISPVIELFGSMKKGEQMWLQLVITPAKKKYGHDKKNQHTWIEEGHKVVAELLEPYGSVKGNEEEPGGAPRMPKWMDSIVEGINNKSLKLGFETGIRFAYVAKKAAFNNNSKRASRLIFNQYANPHLNQLSRVNSTSLASMFFNVPPKKQFHNNNKFLKEYRERAFFFHSLREHIFFPGNHAHTFVLNTEELATLFHFPGQILKVPTLERIESKEAAPPTNLPI